MKRNTEPNQTLPLPRTQSGVKAKETPPATDSSPTPIFVMGYRQIYSHFLLIASRLEAHSLVTSHLLEQLDIKKSKRCSELADEVRRIADRIKNWPDRTPVAVAGEKGWVADKYIDIMTEAKDLIGGKVL